MTPPLIKWPGGKRKLLKFIIPALPSTFARYFEVFAGGAALFFAMQPDQALISDSNANLINLYLNVRDFPDEFIAELSTLENSEANYYKVRSWSPEDPVSRAARFYYLILLSFNGIYRENLRGEFNVPYGHKTHISVVDIEHIYRSSKVLSHADLRVGDFAESLRDCQEGDVVYIDPPYTVAHGENGFVKYNDRIFSWGDQERLASEAKRLVSLGCHVLISNADHESVRLLYGNDSFKQISITRTSQIAANGKHRRSITELLIQGRRT